MTSAPTVANEHLRPQAQPSVAAQLATTPLGLPTIVAAGMRWTLWPSIVALPFSFATNFILARVGPEALGAFGLLNVFIGVVFGFLFLGGCAVPMKFLPDLTPHRRNCFLMTYSLILLMGVVPWLLLPTVRPDVLQFLFGWHGDELKLIYLSPVCLAYVLTISSLKGILDMKWAQVLDRGLTIGLAGVLLMFYLCARTRLQQHAGVIVWLTYMSLTFVVTAVALYRLIASRAITGRPRLWLPPGFWKYSFVLQCSGILNFLNTRLDYLMIVNAGGLLALGQYVAIMTIAGVIPRISSFVVDSLLPSLTNCLSTYDDCATLRVAETYLRLMLPVILGLCLGVVVFVRLALRAMGPEYTNLAALVQCACFGSAVQALNQYSSAIFTATDRLSHNLIATVIRSCAFAGLFWPLWMRMNVAGAVFAWSVAETAYHVASVALLQRNPRVVVYMPRSYAAFLGTLGFVVLSAWSGGQVSYVTGIVVSAVVMMVFFLTAGYTKEELTALAYILTNTRRVARYAA